MGGEHVVDRKRPGTFHRLSPTCSALSTSYPVLPTSGVYRVSTCTFSSKRGDGPTCCRNCGERNLKHDPTSSRCIAFRLDCTTLTGL